MNTPADELSIEIEVAYALPRRQLVLPEIVRAGTTARAAALASGLDQHFEDLDLQSIPLGVWGTAVADDYEMQNGDRLELYRPLLADPKDVRRKLAAEGKTMGKTRD